MVYGMVDRPLVFTLVRADAPAVRLAAAFHRVPRQRAASRGESARPDARDGRLQRVDRGAALRAAQRGGRQGRRGLGAVGRRRGDQDGSQHAARQGAG